MPRHHVCATHTRGGGEGGNGHTVRTGPLFRKVRQPRAATLEADMNGSLDNRFVAVTYGVFKDGVFKDGYDGKFEGR